MEERASPRARLERWDVAAPDLYAVGVLVAVKLLVHLWTANRYGYFRDELYSLDLGRHLAWGYVDTAPMIALYAKVALLLGGALPVLRTIAALGGAVRIVLTMLLAREMGGGRFAQILAGLLALAAPIYLGVDSILTMNGFESLFWMGCILALIRIVRTGDSRLWVWFGVLAGLGLENKHSTLIFGVAVTAALLLGPERRELLKPWIWIGGGVALLIFLPNLLWQVRHGYPTLEDLENVRRTGKNVVLGPAAFVGQQILLLNPLLLPFWIAGLVSLLFGKGSRLRVLGFLYLALLALMIGLKAKNYYLAPIYPMLLAAGAVASERWLAGRDWSRGRIWPRVVLSAYVFSSGAILVPALLPFLPPEGVVAYLSALGVKPPRTEVRQKSRLEQRLADQFGWEGLVSDVSRAYRALPEAERARTGIFASNYGEAGALNLFGPALGLPPAICAHQNHFLWGPPTAEYENLIWLQWGREDIEERCRSVEKVGEHFDAWGMDEENRPIYLCRGLKAPLKDLWPELKHWN